MNKKLKEILLIFIICSLNFGFSFSQEKNNIKDKFLIVLDIQEYYTLDKLSESSTQKLIDSVNYVINSINTDKVIYVKTTHKLLNLSLAYPFIYISMDTSAMRIDKRINLVNENIFIKEKSNLFAMEDINNLLKNNNAKEIVIIGLMAEDCVYKSLIGGNEIGYTMFVIPEAIHAKSQNSKDKTIKKLGKKGIKILGINSLSNK